MQGNVQIYLHSSHTGSRSEQLHGSWPTVVLQPGKDQHFCKIEFGIIKCCQDLWDMLLYC